jgi:hypothetical protein
MFIIYSKKHMEKMIIKNLSMLFHHMISMDFTNEALINGLKLGTSKYD